MELRLALLLLLVAGAWGAGLGIERWSRAKAWPGKFALSDAGGGGPVVVEFVSPYCLECKQIQPLLREAATGHGAVLTVLDVTQRPDLARRYGVRATPTTLVVDDHGKVTGGWVGTPDRSELASALST